LASQPSDGLAWRAGLRFPIPPPEPLACSIDRDRPGEMPAGFLAARIPLLSMRVLDVLRSIGIDNLDTYRATIDGCDPDQEGEYAAVNIIGLVSAADMEESRVVAGSAPPMAEFTELVIDPERARDHRLFRLAENPSFIIVDRSVHDALETLAPINLRAIPLSDPAAY
jgi:hypothetical protein